MSDPPDITQDDRAQATAGPTLAQIAGRVLNRPLLLHPDKADLILHVLQGRIGVEPLQAITPETNRFIGSHRRDSGATGSMRTLNGVALLPIVGSLVNRGAWIGASSGLVSYEGIAAQLREAQADPEVQAVLLDIDSPGGEATGMFATANIVRTVNEVKPVVAFVNDVAASAAYGIASAAREIVVSPTSMLGSIGVVLTHLDRSGELEERGVKPTLIHAGAHKVDGHPFGPLSDAVRADLQAEVMKIYDQFVGLVAEGRGGRISSEAIRATEARTYLGADAIAHGLADRMASLDAVIAALSQPPSGARTDRREGPMTKTTQSEASQGGASNAPAATDAPGISPADMHAAVEAARAEAREDGITAGKAEATARIQAILTAPEAEGRDAQALVLALETEMAAADAARVLAASPKASPAVSIADRAAQEPARLRPRVASQYAERAADPDRVEVTVHGIFSAGPAQDDLSGQARGGKMSGTTKLASTAAEFWIAKAQVDALPWVPVTGDALVLTARSDAPVHAVTRIATTDLGDLTLTLVREDPPT